MIPTGLFDALFGRFVTMPAIRGYFRTLTAYQPAFYNRAGGLYEMDRTRSAIERFSVHCSKLKPNVTGAQAKKLNSQLQVRMNPWQLTSQFLARAATILETDNTCFLVPVLNEAGKTIGAFTAVPSRVELVESTTGVLYLRYEFSDGRRAAIEYDRCGVLVKMQYHDDFFGESNAALGRTMDLIDLQNQGINNAIKQGAAIRFMAKLGQALRPEDIEKERQRFVASNLSAENDGGVMMFDSKYAEVKQVDSRPYVIDSDQMKIIDQRVDYYFGSNDKILRNDYDEETWGAYYEGKVEPFALQLSLALTCMFFSEREIALGAGIIFSANRLQFASISTKLNAAVNLFDRGIINRNESREIMQMSPIPGPEGDAYYIRGEYVNVNERGGEPDA